MYILSLRVAIHIPALAYGGEWALTSDHVTVSVSKQNRSFNRLVPSQPPNMNSFYLTTVEEWLALGGG